MSLSNSRPKTFKGANVFMSRNLVPPEVFDALLDALRLNGADVFLCCDPSRNAPNDFHIISSPDHEKFEDLRAKGCNLLGPQCVLSCAKEHRELPKLGFTCCLAMDGVKVVASGFDIDEKVKIEKLVTAMGGQLHSKASLDVNFVIVKNVLAAKYKWAVNILKKPVVTCNWLYQCWNEHRVVPQESYRVLPFLGLFISVTRIPADERKEIEKIITDNGGKYSAELTKKCTHLICDAPEGDKYKVARRWGHIQIVSRKWFDQSVARRACLNEESYPIQGSSAPAIKTMKGLSMAQHSQDKCMGNSLSMPSSVAADSSFTGFPGVGVSDPDLEFTLSQNMSSMFSDPPVFVKEGDNEMLPVHPMNDTNLAGCIANDSQSEDSDLYLSECRISLVGFEAVEMRKLVRLVRSGGGSRYMSLNDQLTHIIVGAPTELEKKELRGLAASGVIDVVRPKWLEDCIRQKKEVPVLRQHVAYDLLLPKDPLNSGKGTVVGVNGMNQAKVSSPFPSIHSDQLLGSANFQNGMRSALENNREEKAETDTNGSIHANATLNQSEKNLSSVVNDQKRGVKKTLQNSSSQNQKPSTVFRGKLFRFSSSFPLDRRAEIVQWVSQGGGEMVEDNVKEDVHFTIECHGMISGSVDGPQTTYVSSHWVRSCLEDGSLLDVDSHIIYSPLPCRVPLPGFENFRFCISQYEEKDRLLLRNLCFVLGAKFVEKLSRKVTHLVCKFTNGPKYDAACKWGICSITSEWIYECVRQNDIVALDQFQPKEVTSQDQEAGLCNVSQFTTQATRMVNGENPSQLTSQSQVLRSAPTQIGSNGISSLGENTQKSVNFSKKARLLVSDDPKRNNLKDTRGNNSKDTGGSSSGVPDVAAAIEDLLEQTSKLYPSDPMLGEDIGGSHSLIGLPNHWLNRTGKKDELSNSTKDVNRGGYDGFSETQTESQVVGYEEDLSGRQMLIDRVRTRSSLV
ncbi:uncharacterized protein LOC126664850 isoform X2 [Mercurialis annua]|uniref:uncharacterized protein LOC126664850 isoform X2 n=1 Tax=Mercurialis annua TaxID=3986 RepID=UPI002160DE79|nr:uncharacterized protein LOC126664850 isoform X2 [Mercurialis annua]